MLGQPCHLCDFRAMPRQCARRQRVLAWRHRRHRRGFGPIVLADDFFHCDKVVRWEESMATFVLVHGAGPYAANSSNIAFASFRSRVSKPSVNQR